MMRSTRELNTTLKREPSIRELAEKMGVSGRYVQKLQNISRKSYSLDATYNDRGDQSLLDKLEDDRFPLPIDIVNAGKRAVQIRGWLDMLEANERKVLRLRFGLDGEPQTLEKMRVLRLRFGLDGEPQTLEKIGNAFGVTRERVRQIEAKALKKLKKITEEMHVNSPEAI
jgi:RNA polymerase primary sigma factor